MNGIHAKMVVCASTEDLFVAFMRSCVYAHVDCSPRCLKKRYGIFFPAVPCSGYLQGFDKDGWMDDLRFYVLFNSVSVISGRWADDNERLCS